MQLALNTHTLFHKHLLGHLKSCALTTDSLLYSSMSIEHTPTHLTQQLGLVDELIASVVASIRTSLRVLVRHARPQSLHHLKDKQHGKRKHVKCLRALAKNHGFARHCALGEERVQCVLASM